MKLVSFFGKIFSNTSVDFLIDTESLKQIIAEKNESLLRKTKAQTFLLLAKKYPNKEVCNIMNLSISRLERWIEQYEHMGIESTYLQ